MKLLDILIALAPIPVIMFLVKYFYDAYQKKQSQIKPRDRAIKLYGSEEKMIEAVQSISDEKLKELLKNFLDIDNNSLGNDILKRG